MYVAMNRFKIAPGREEEFVEIWRQRDSFLSEVPGFKSFNLLRGPTTGEYTLFASHSIWESEQAFIDRTHSRAAISLNSEHQNCLNIAQTRRGSKGIVGSLSS